MCAWVCARARVRAGGRVCVDLAVHLNPVDTP